MPAIMTRRPIDDVKARRDKSAGADQRSKSSFADDLIREINAAVREANAGDFASDAEVATLAKKWKLNASR
jgi:RHH-type transcriptional regulator, rel operon repressor / antitoxin RelB